MTTLDLAIVGAYLVFAIGLGLRFFRRGNRTAEGFFVGERKLTWWVAGTSMVATTFAADTPLAVTGIVAADGISGNWIWWCWAIAHLTATFFFARLWRRSGVVTDAEIVELRYGGRTAAALRGFKAVYFGVFINCLTMAWVIAAMVKIARSFFDIEPGWVIVVCIAASVIYTSLGGFRSVVVTDFVQFLMGIGGAVALALLVIHQAGGLGAVPDGGSSGEGLLGAVATELAATGERTVEDVLGYLPSADHPTIPWIYFAVLLIAGWWRLAEGYGYIVQRLAACKNEAHAQAANLWFAVAHNALRPWPWILVGLASLVVYPKLPAMTAESLAAQVQLADGRTVEVTVSPARLDVALGGELEVAGAPDGCALQLAEQRVPLRKDSSSGAQRASFAAFAESGNFPLGLDCGDRTATGSLGTVRVELADREMAYPLLMKQTLPPGLLGLVVASLLAAFMSTIDTHTNWGASYLVQDVYRRFMRPNASTRHYLVVSRLLIVALAVAGGVTALFVHNIAAVWRFLIALGAGSGSVAAARWYWPRVTAQAEFAALGTTTLMAIGLELFGTEHLFGGSNPLCLVTVPAWAKIVLIAVSSLAVWVPVALFGPRNERAVLESFARKVRPPGPTWSRYLEADTPVAPLAGAVARFAASLWVVFGTLFGTGDLLLGRPLRGAILVATAAFLALVVVRGNGSARNERVQ